MITWTIYGICFFGVYLVEADNLRYYFKLLRNRFFIRRKLKDFNEINRTVRTTPVFLYLNMLIENTSISAIFQNPDQIIRYMAISFVLVIVTGVKFLSLPISLLLGGFIAFSPVVIGRVQLTGKRAVGSKEAAELMQEILNNYRIEQYNMKEAIELTASTIENAPVSKGILLNLAKGLSNASNDEEINNCLDKFRYAYGTTWANILASNIYFAVRRGICVDAGLVDLSKAVTKSREIEEHRKRENFDAYLILKYLIPISYLLSFVAGVKFFNISAKKFIMLQFFTPTGFKWFSITVMCYLAGICILKLFSEEKMDI